MRFPISVNGTLEEYERAWYELLPSGNIMNFYRMVSPVSYFKIFKSIVFSISVYMVNHLIRSEISTNFLFYYKTMFSNIAVFISKWMGWLFNYSISVGISANSALPIGIIFERKSAFLFPSNGTAFKGASYLFTIFSFNKRGITDCAILGRHYSHCTTNK
jgi:hypothetical protein